MYGYTVDSRYLELAYLRITAYLEVKILPRNKHKNLITCEKYCGTEEKLLLKSNFKGEIAPEEQCLLFSTIFFTISLTSRVHLHINLLNVFVRIICPQFCKSDVSRYGYLEVLQRVP